jgi:hypothetical protein
MPPGASVFGSMAGGATNKVGLLVSGDTSFNIYSNVIAPTINSAIIAYTGKDGTAIVGISQTGTVIYGLSTDNYAVRGTSCIGYQTHPSSKLQLVTLNSLIHSGFMSTIRLC